MKNWTFIFLLLFVSGCSNETNQNSIIPKEKMIDVMSEVYILEMYYQKKSALPTVYKPALNKALGKLLEKHHLSKKQYMKSFTYYARDYETFQEMNLEIIQRYNEASVQK